MVRKKMMSLPPPQLYSALKLLLAIVFTIGVIIVYTHSGSRSTQRVGMGLVAFSAAIIFLMSGIKGIRKGGAAR